MPTHGALIRERYPRHHDVISRRIRWGIAHVGQLFYGK